MAIDISAIAELSDREPDFYVSRVPGRYFSDTGTIIKIDMWAHSIQEWYNRVYSADILSNYPRTNVIVAGADIGIMLEMTIWCKLEKEVRPILNFSTERWNRAWQVGNHALYIDNSLVEDRFIVAQIEADTVHDLFVGKLL